MALLNESRLRSLAKSWASQRVGWRGDPQCEESSLDAFVFYPSLAKSRSAPVRQGSRQISDCFDPVRLGFTMDQIRGSRLLDGDASLRVLPEVLARGGYRSPVFFV